MGGKIGNSEKPDRLQDAYAARDGGETANFYDEWAADYEREVSSYGYATPGIIAGLLARHVKPDEGAVLDAGAGTGIMGEILAPLGYRALFGIDLSEKMLALARSKSVYRDLRQMELGKRLDLPDESFSAVVAAGVFSPGHAPPNSFEELIRVTEPGGHIVFSVRTDEDAGFGQQQKALEDESRWRLAEATEPYRQLPRADPDLRARCFAYRVN